MFKSYDNFEGIKYNTGISLELFKTMWYLISIDQCKIFIFIKHSNNFIFKLAYK